MLPTHISLLSLLRPAPANISRPDEVSLTPPLDFALFATPSFPELDQVEETVGRSPRSRPLSGLGGDSLTAEIARGGQLYDETHHVLRQLRLRERHIRYTIAGLVLIFGVVGGHSGSSHRVVRRGRYGGR